ncbi:hypothetical protein SAMN05519103_09325 [Rhizobiales bacterium GAS113]|nr:hypothetical protein SAMN05519103_09325 [Rhizobiales bacterium GAS113]
MFLRVNPGIRLTAVLIILRAAFLLLGEPLINGDGIQYVKGAQEILLNGELPPARYQPLGFSVVLAPIIALTGEKAVHFDYDVSMPYAGDRIANAVHVAQVLMDLVVVLILIHEAGKLLTGRTKPVVTTCALAFFALQPFTAALTTSVYPDQMCMFFFFVGGYLIFRALSGSWKMLWLAAGSLFLGIAGLTRVDMLPVCAGLLLFAYTIIFRQWRDRARLGAIAMSTVIFLLAPASMLIFQYRSTGEIGYLHLRPPPTETYTFKVSKHVGYLAWLRTWVIFVQGEHVVFASPDETPVWLKSGADINVYPRRAFKSDEQRNEIAALLDSWRQNGYTNDIDAGFMRNAEANRREHPVTTYGVVPVARMLHYWINLEGARAIFDTLGLEPPLSWIATASVFPFRVLFVVLGAIGLYVVWFRQRTRMFCWSDGLGLARVGSLMVIFRTGEFCVLGLFVGGGLMETRYIIVALPAMLLLAVVGLRRIAGGAERHEPDGAPMNV